MAIDKEFLAAHFQGVEKADEHISAIIAEYEKTNLPLVKNRDDILAEKKAVEKKTAELQEKYAALEAAHKELNEKLESGMPEKEKKIFKEEIDGLKKSIVDLNDKHTKAIAEYEEKIANLSKEKTDYIIGEEFSKLANARTDYQPGARKKFEDAFFQEYPKSNFEPYEYGGKKEYVNKEGKKMTDLFNGFANAEENKFFFMNTNQGGGAPGSSGAKGGANTVTREQLNSMNDVQKAEFFNKGGKIAS